MRLWCSKAPTSIKSPKAAIGPRLQNSIFESNPDENDPMTSPAPTRQAIRPTRRVESGSTFVAPTAVGNIV